MSGGGGGRDQSVPRPVQVCPRDRGLQKQGPADCAGHPSSGHHGNVSQRESEFGLRSEILCNKLQIFYYYFDSNLKV